eukprot:767968-Hanusia_phi.AAC.4
MKQIAGSRRRGRGREWEKEAMSEEELNELKVWRFILNRELLVTGFGLAGAAAHLWSTQVSQQQLPALPPTSSSSCLSSSLLLLLLLLLLTRGSRSSRFSPGQLCARHSTGNVPPSSPAPCSPLAPCPLLLLLLSVHSLMLTQRRSRSSLPRGYDSCQQGTAG